MKSLAIVLLLAVPLQAAPAIPLDAVNLALQDAQSIGEAAAQRRYIWCPNALPEEVIAAKMVVNIAISQVAFDIHPQVIAGGQLVAIDLQVCTPDEVALAGMLTRWASLAVREPYFHVQVVNQKVKITPYKASDGKTYDFKVIAAAVPAPHLGEAGVALEVSVGNANPTYQSFCPIVRVDWLVKELLTTADGGRYYDFRGLVPQKTKLADYLKSRGLTTPLEKLTSRERAAMMSVVTGKARGINIAQGQESRPSVGAALIAVTDDLFDDTVGAQTDPFRNLLKQKPDGNEVFVTLPSGWIEYTLWDGNGLLVVEAPPNLVSDHTVKEPHTARLQAAISCIRCHGLNDGWQPFVNEVQLSLPLLDPLGDLSNQNPQSVLTELATRFGGDLGPVIKTAQDNFDRRVFAVTGVGAADASASVSRVFERHEYDYVTAAIAADEVGWNLLPNDTIGVQTFRQVVPPLDPAGRVVDDPIIGRLHVDYLDVVSGQRKGLKLTRRQWEQVYPDVMNRTMPILMKLREEAEKVNPNALAM